MKRIQVIKITKVYYHIIMRICWLLEDIHDLFCKDEGHYYPSTKWEDKLNIVRGEHK